MEINGLARSVVIHYLCQYFSRLAESSFTLALYLTARPINDYFTATDWIRDTEMGRKKSEINWNGYVKQLVFSNPLLVLSYLKKPVSLAVWAI